METTDDAETAQLLAARSAVPIAQLSPSLPDQATRTVHGEVTVTWPYSAVTKTLAFLLAEPDVRLRRDKGLVRVQLTGPSAQAVGAWELGSGDDVVLALDGVEWADDAEPARPPGSRLGWQLKFAGKLILKARLGETDETKSINIDQTVPFEPAEHNPFADIDFAVFNDDEPDAEKAPMVRPSPKPAAPLEFASPMFAKRSRASYAPLFELELDTELEADGGKRGKGRKRPRYSVHGGRWRYREESSSPEPEAAPESPSHVREENGDVVMQDTPAKPVMTDEGCQVQELDLAPHPSSSLNTPVKSGFGMEPSPSFGPLKLAQPSSAATADTGVQAAPSRPKASPPSNGHQGQAKPAPAAPNPFAAGSGFASFPQGNTFGPGSGTSFQDSNAPRAPFTQPFGQPSSLFGTGPAPTSVFSQNPNAGGGSAVPHGSGMNSVRFGFGQPSQPTFGTASFEPSQPSEQHYKVSAYPDPSLGQQGSSYYQAPPEQPSAFGDPARREHFSNQVEGAGRPQSNREMPLYSLGTHAYDSRHAVGRLDVADDLGSDHSIPAATPPGMIPPEVQDGTRNVDEMSQEGILSNPVFEQDVPRAALPGPPEQFVDEDGEGPMDSDERADYDSEDKGDDYDLRNYDSVSDDDEGFNVAPRPLPDDELMEDDEVDEDEMEEEDELANAGSRLYPEEEDYDSEEEYDYEEEEDDYEEDNHYSRFPPATATPQPPPAQKAPVVIDLLSDSDEDDEPPARAPPTQLDGLDEKGPDDERDGRLVRNSPPFSAPQTFRDRPGSLQDPERDEEADEGVEAEEEELRDEDNAMQSQDVGEDDGEEELLEEPENEAMPHGGVDDASSDIDQDHESEIEDQDKTEQAAAVAVKEVAVSTAETENRPVLEEPDSTVQDAENEALSHQEQEEEEISSPVNEAAAKVETVANWSEAEKSASPGPQSAQNVIEGEMQSEGGIADDAHEARFRSEEAGDRMVLDEEPTREAAESFQTQPAEMLASFDTQITDMTTSTQPIQDQDTRNADVDEEVVLLTESQVEALDQHQQSESEAGVNELTGEDADADSQQPASTEAAEPRRRGSERRSEREQVPAQDVETCSDEQPDQPRYPPILMHGSVSSLSVDMSMTTVASHPDTQFSGRQQTTVETQETEVVFSRPKEVEWDPTDSENKDVDMADAEAAAEVETNTGNGDVVAANFGSEDEMESEVKDIDHLNLKPRPEAYTIVSTPSPQKDDDQVPASADNESKRHTRLQIDGTHSDEDDASFHDAHEVHDMAKSSPVDSPDDRASFVTADSQASQRLHETDEGEQSPSVKPKRGGKKKARKDSSTTKTSKPTSASKRSQRQAYGLALGSQRATRSKTMSFQQQAESTNGEDMSVQLARAALKSPPTKRKKTAAAASGTRLNNNNNNKTTDLVQRLDAEMPDCVTLNSLKSHNTRTLDVAGVAVSAHTCPSRTKTRQYVTSFSITDPSISPGAVVDVAVYHNHKDSLPVVAAGDAVLLRRFTVTALSGGRAFGLRSHEDDASWAVFEAAAAAAAEQQAAPQMRGPPVELDAGEDRFLRDLRAWYGGLDEAARQRLDRAVGEMVERGRESRAGGGAGEQH